MHFTEDRYRWTLENMLAGVETFISIYVEMDDAEDVFVAPEVTQAERLTVQNMRNLLQSAMDVHDKYRSWAGEDGVELPMNDYVVRLQTHLDYLRDIGVDGFDADAYPEDVVKLLLPLETKLGVKDHGVGRPVIHNGQVIFNVGDLCDICNKPITEGAQVNIQKIIHPGRPMGARVAHAECMPIPEGAKQVEPHDFGR